MEAVKPIVLTNTLANPEDPIFQVTLEVGDFPYKKHVYQVRTSSADNARVIVIGQYQGPLIASCKTVKL